MKIGVISDTHLGASSRRVLPSLVFSEFEGVDLILHGGDLTHSRVISELETIAPVMAVRGNNDGSELGLPVSRRLELGGCIIGMAHGDRAHGSFTPPPLPYPGNTHAAANALSHFVYDGDVSCVIFGHSHRPLCAWHPLSDKREILLLNPGSPTDKRWGPHFGIALLEIENGALTPETIQW